jgi:hypothetical protein
LRTCTTHCTVQAAEEQVASAQAAGTTFASELARIREDMAALQVREGGREGQEPG